MLRESFHALKRKATPGIDGVTHAAYAEDLEASLADLEKRLAEGRYRATPVKRRWIPKSGGKLRPLGIPVLEDKIVQHAVRRILEAIGNSSMTAKYQREVNRLLYKWLNRRSQRRSMTWTQFGRRLPGWDLPPPRVVELPLTPVLRPTPRPA
jgi:hypothetical protein